MSSYYRGNVADFLSRSETDILAELELAYANHGYTRQYSDQTLTWSRDLHALRASLEICVSSEPSAEQWGILLEFSIPRKEKRIDAILLVKSEIVVIEAKSGAAFSQARLQLEEYSLLLHYFHKSSDSRRIIPLIVSPEAHGIDPDLNSLFQFEMFPELPTYWVSKVITTSWESVPMILEKVSKRSKRLIDLIEFDNSKYYPVPSIIEAAVALKSGLDIREIAHCEASEYEIGMVKQAIQKYVNDAQANSQHAICFLTGVPGSGKTLVGLSLAHSAEDPGNVIHFMSGNGPLVQVLQHLFTQEARRHGISAPHARIEARTLIENVHVFARHYIDVELGSPSNHAIIFDEAQRAWNRRQNKRKFNRDYSEPEMLLSIMERHTDWAVVIALVGGGQEIHDGEAGLEEWGRALAQRPHRWTIYASPEVLDGGPSTAGHRLFDEATVADSIHTNSALHLRTSNRSLRAENLAQWVNYVLEGDAVKASSLRITERFPVFLTRNLKQARGFLRMQGIGSTRYGLVGSSGAMRLRAEGLEPSSTFHADYQWEHWYLGGQGDVRSSFQLEVCATEFEIQGLELDWIGLCWGGDMIWDDAVGWRLRVFRQGRESRWLPIRNSEKRDFRKNAYRVLLTRARQGMVIFVPRGDREDQTVIPEEYDATASFLLSCGVKQLNLP